MKQIKGILPRYKLWSSMTIEITAIQLAVASENLKQRHTAKLR